MAQVVLEGSGVMPIVGEFVTSGVPEHVRVNREWQLGSFSGPSNHLQESCGRGGTASLGDEDISSFHILAAAIEILGLVEVLEAANKRPIIRALNEAGAGRAAEHIKRSMFTRLHFLVARAYGKIRRGDRNTRKARSKIFEKAAMGGRDCRGAAFGRSACGHPQHALNGFGQVSGLPAYCAFSPGQPACGVGDEAKTERRFQRLLAAAGDRGVMPFVAHRSRLCLRSVHRITVCGSSSTTTVSSEFFPSTSSPRK